MVTSLFEIARLAGRDDQTSSVIAERFGVSGCENLA
jgi:hypothetical protein